MTRRMPPMEQHVRLGERRKEWMMSPIWRQDGARRGKSWNGTDRQEATRIIWQGTSGTNISHKSDFIMRASFHVQFSTRNSWRHGTYRWIMMSTNRQREGASAAVSSYHKMITKIFFKSYGGSRCATSGPCGHYFTSTPKVAAPWHRLWWRWDDELIR